MSIEEYIESRLEQFDDYIESKWNGLNQDEQDEQDDEWDEWEEDMEGLDYLN